MNKRLALLACAIAAVAALCCLALAGCSTSSKSGFAVGDDIAVIVDGKTLKVELAGNPTTGYEWSATLDGDAATLTNTEFEVGNKIDTAALGIESSSEVGVSGLYTYTYTGAKAGNVTMHFTYARSWETTSSDRTLTVTATVGSNGNFTSAQAESSDGSSGSTSISHS